MSEEISCPKCKRALLNQNCDDFACPLCKVTFMKVPVSPPPICGCRKCKKEAIGYPINNDPNHRLIITMPQ